MGDVLNFRNVPAGEEGLDIDIGGLSVGLMLTDTGFESGSCFGGSFSGGPIGLSSLFRFLFFSRRFSSSSDRPLSRLFLSLALSSLRDFEGGIGVMVIVLGRDAGGVVPIGMISIPGRRSSPIPDKTEFKLDDKLEDDEVLIGVILTDGGTIFLPSMSSIIEDGDFLSSLGFLILRALTAFNISSTLSIS